MLPGHVTFFQPLCSPHFLSSYNLCTSSSTYQESSFFCIFFLKTVTVVILHFCCCSYSVSSLLKWKLREVRVCLCSSPYLLPLHTVLVQWPVQRIFNYYIQLHSVCLSLNTSQTKMLLIPQNTTPLTELPCCRIQGMMARVSKGMMACLITSCTPDIGLSTWIVCSEVECYSSWLQVTVTLFFHQAKNLQVSLVPLSLSHLTITLPGDSIGATFKLYQLLSHSRPLPPQPEPLSLLQ